MTNPQGLPKLPVLKIEASNLGLVGLVEDNTDEISWYRPIS